MGQISEGSIDAQNIARNLIEVIVGEVMKALNERTEPHFDSFENLKLQSFGNEEILVSVKSEGRSLEELKIKENLDQGHVNDTCYQNLSEICVHSCSTLSTQGEGDFQPPYVRETKAFYHLESEGVSGQDQANIDSSHSSVNTSFTDELIAQLHVDINNISFDNINLSDSEVEKELQTMESPSEETKIQINRCCQTSSSNNFEEDMDFTNEENYHELRHSPKFSPCDALDGDGSHRPTIVWFKKDGTPLPIGRAFVTGGNLTVSNIQESDSGLYQCVASNEAATITSETEIMVENTAPRAPYNLTAESTTTSITVRWLAAGTRNNGEYSIWYRLSDVPEWRTMRLQSRGSTEATISNLLPGREYELMVLSQDSQGDGMFSKAFRARTKAPAPGIVIDSPASPQPWHTPTGAPIEPFQQISRPLNVRVDLSPVGYRVEWDPPVLGVDILSHYTVRWYRHGHQQLAETMETTDHFIEIPHLEEQSTYVFTVTAVTTSKYTAESERLTLQVPAYGRNKVATIATVMCVALLVAAVATVWYVRRWYRNSGVKASHITT